MEQELDYKNGTMTESFNSNLVLRKKKLLVITPHFLTFIHDQIKAMASDFEEINVIVCYPFMISHTLLKSFRSIKLSYRSRIDRTDLPENIKIYKCKYLSLPGKSLQHFKGPLGYFAVKNLIDKHKIQFDLIQTHFLWPTGYFGIKLKQVMDIPLIITGHGYDVYELPFRSNKWLKRIKNMLEQSDAIITVSKKNIELFKKITHKKVFLISNGYDNKKFVNNLKIDKSKLELPETKKIILSVGNLEPVKGHYYLISAIEKIIEFEKNILCIIIGGGKLFNSLSRTIKKHKLQNYIKLLGSKPHNEIPLWMNSCDIFVIPSLNESGPVILFEAMACGKPVVGTEVGIIKDILKNSKLGIVTQPKNADALSKSILKVLYKEYDDNYIKTYAKDFSWDIIKNKILSIYIDKLKTNNNHKKKI